MTCRSVCSPSIPNPIQSSGSGNCQPIIPIRITQPTFRNNKKFFLLRCKKSLTNNVNNLLFTACESDQWELFRNIVSISDYMCSGFPRCLIRSNQFSISPAVWQTGSQEAIPLLPTGFKLSICLINLKTPISALWPTVYVLHTQN